MEEALEALRVIRKDKSGGPVLLHNASPNGRGIFKFILVLCNRSFSGTV